MEIYKDGYTKQAIMQHALRYKYNILEFPFCLHSRNSLQASQLNQMQCTCVLTSGETFELLGHPIFSPSQFIALFFQMSIIMPFSLSMSHQYLLLFLILLWSFSYFTEKNRNIQRGTFISLYQSHLQSSVSVPFFYILPCVMTNELFIYLYKAKPSTSK